MRRCLLSFLLVIIIVIDCLSQIRPHKSKTSPLINLIINNSNLTDSLNISISYKQHFQHLQNKSGLRVISSYAPANILIARVAPPQLLNIISDEQVIFTDLIRIPKEEITTGTLDISLNRINYVHSKFPEVTGASIVASIKEQRFDTTDIDFINRYINSGVAAPTFTTHAAVIATMIAGAGTSTPFARGAALGTTVTSSSFFSLLPDPDSVYKRFGISIQNHSYGTAIENYYGNDAAAYDASVIINPSLVHVFSSGNVGTTSSTSGNYSNISGFANLTGSFKMSKNSITVGGVDSFANVAELSSRGPAYDGRVKPDIVAYGEGGSSGAAALVSGTAALVQHTYKLNANNNLPPASLVKAVLINSAEDLLARNVDYISGFGNLNAYNAIKTIYERRFKIDSITNGQVKNYPFTIPQGTQKFKITIAWTDPPAVPNASKALVNDIDIIFLNTSTGETWQPWVLNHSPQRDSLLKPAERKKDTLNNVEQISLENPSAGDYIIKVQGSKIITPIQTFSLAYQTDSVNSFLWTFPSSTDVIRAGVNNVIRWQTNISGRGVIEYSTNGSTWSLITDTAELLKQYFRWTAPDTISSALLRMTPVQNRSFNSDTFVISKPISIQVAFNCADSFLLTWNKVPVQQYTLYRLGEKYLEPVRVTTDTFALLHKTQFPSLYYSVAPMINRKPGLRSSTVNYTMQGSECYFRSFYLQFQNSDRAVFTGVTSTLFNVAEVRFQKLINGQFVTLRSFQNPTSATFSPTDSALIQGLNIYRMQVRLHNGSLINSNEVIVYHFGEKGVIVYPNPVAQGVMINIITNGITGNRIEIYNATGAFIEKLELKFTLTQLQSNRLAKGVYFLRIISDEGEVSTQKLVVH